MRPDMWVVPTLQATGAGRPGSCVHITNANVGFDKVPCISFKLPTIYSMQLESVTRLGYTHMKAKDIVY